MKLKFNKAKIVLQCSYCTDKQPYSYFMCLYGSHLVSHHGAGFSSVRCGIAHFKAQLLNHKHSNGKIYSLNSLQQQEGKRFRKSIKKIRVGFVQDT